ANDEVVDVPFMPQPPEAELAGVRLRTDRRVVLVTEAVVGHVHAFEHSWTGYVNRTIRGDGKAEASLSLRTGGIVLDGRVGLDNAVVSSGDNDLHGGTRPGIEVDRDGDRAIVVLAEAR